MSRQQQIKAKSENHELTINDHESDSPLLPIQQIEQLHRIRPDKVDWVFEQTEIEAASRRAENHRINTFLFIERLAGVFCGFILGYTGLTKTIELALQGHDVAAASIGGTTLVSLVGAFIYVSKKK